MTPLLAILALLAAAILLLPPVSATVTFSESGKQFHSRPASFGFDLEYGLQYVALLQVVDEDLHLCAGIDEEEEGEGGDAASEDWEGERGEDWEEEVAERRGLRFRQLPELERLSQSTTAKEATIVGSGPDVATTMMMMMEGSALEGDSEDAPEGDGRDDNATGPKEIRVVPSHGVPVAILAKRGQCSYETKARIASTLTSPHGTVRFLVVYDNVPGDGSRLITMSASTAGEGGNRGRGHQLYKDLGLVFVSYESGVDLREYINTQSRRTASTGGPRILIDGSDHWVFPPMDESAAGLAFLLMLFGCVCSLSLFLNTTFYGGGRGSGDSINEAHLFLLGPDGQTAAGNNNHASQGSRRRGNGLRLLTLEEVETLPTREYCTQENADLDSNLELRDKSEMPYLADEEVNHVDNGNNNDDSRNLNEGQQQQEQDSATLHDGIADHEEYSPPRQFCSGGGGGGGLCEHLLPTKKDKEDPYHFNQNSCSICLEDYEPGEQIRVLPCQHTFHSSCIFPWLTERSPTCPLCKAMFEAVQYEEEGGEGQQQEGDEGAAGSNDDDEEEGVDEQPRSDGVEGRAEATGNAIAPPSLEEEPPIHRRRASRRQRREDRQAERASRRSRRDRNADGTVAAPAGVPDGEGVVEAAASMSDNAAMASREEEEPSSSPARGRSSAELRGSWMGLFGAGATTTTNGAATSGNNALEEPLLTNDDDGGGEIV